MVGAADRAALRAYLAPDVVISSGGTSLVEHYTLFRRWASFEFAFAAGRPLVLFTQSLGPFARPTNRRLAAGSCGERGSCSCATSAPASTCERSERASCGAR